MFLLSNKEIHLLSHIFVYFGFGITHVEESPEAFHFKCVYASLRLCCQSPVLAYTEEDTACKCLVELKLDLEADVSIFFQMMLSVDIAYMATTILVLIFF